MNLRLCGTISSLVLASLSSPAMADPKPKGAQFPNTEKIARAYGGKTDIWADNCNGGAYFAPTWQVRAWCADSSDNIGAGTWSVDAAGRLCHDMSWYFPDGSGRAGKSAGEQACINHVVDRSGKLWRNWPGDAEWWPMDASSGLVKGYKFRTNVQQTQAKLGL